LSLGSGWHAEKAARTKKATQKTQTKHKNIHDDFDSAYGNSVSGERCNKERQTCKEEA
jgi:hypothetical protein